MNRSVWTESFRVRTSDADMFGLARLDALFGYFQEAAGHHAQSLGVGRKSLEAQECFWVLSRCWMQVHCYPVWGQDVVVRTWPCGIQRLFALRHFRLHDQNGQEFGAGVSAWLILDLRQHRPLRPGPFLKEIVMPDEPSVAGDVLEKKALVQGLQELRRICVPFSDLDVNRHVNNAAYVRWVLDSFDHDQHEQKQIRSIRIDYLAETLLGETISIQGQLPFSTRHQTVAGLRTPSVQPVFQAKLAWQHRICRNRFPQGTEDPHETHSPGFQ